MYDFICFAFYKPKFKKMLKRDPNFLSENNKLTIESMILFVLLFINQN